MVAVQITSWRTAELLAGVILVVLAEIAACVLAAAQTLLALESISR
jgi:hypothetical protein